jgi:hypothetical protein
MLVVDFECQAADIDEERRSNEQPSDYVCRMSAEKAAKVWIPGTVGTRCGYNSGMQRSCDAETRLFC